MCGISFLLIANRHSEEYIDELSNSFNNTLEKINYRGPDCTVKSKIIPFKKGVYSIFHRLAVMGLSYGGRQPFITTYGNVNYSVLCNGEIYNFRSIIDKFKDTYPITNLGSDCEIITKLIELGYGIEEIFNLIDGEFALVIHTYNISNGNEELYYGTDYFGVRPLFISHNSNYISIGSEVKNVYLDNNSKVKRVEPGKIHYKCFSSKSNNNLELIKCRDKMLDYHNIFMRHSPIDSSFETYKKKIQIALEEAVEKRLHSDSPLGFLLSGGLDSSLVCAIAAKKLKKPIRTFSIGMEGSTDESNAKKVSEFIGSEHKHIKFSKKEFLDNIENTVYACESYDITTIRASVGQYLISKWIKENTDIKVLLVGDGSDELTSGYLYFHKAKTAREADEENINLLRKIHLYDGLRMDRCISNNGLEVRVPFLDNNFCQTYLSIPEKLRIPINGQEKWLLRNSFKDENILPTDILFRTKEAFSDGVSSKEDSWHKIIKNYLEEINFDKKITYDDKPFNRESKYYYYLFDKWYGYNKSTKDLIPEYWMPKWVGNEINDPSAREI
jgi:asparagine synthase (glutamine-hydrolysing)